MVAKVEQEGRLWHQGSEGAGQGIPQLWHLGKPIKPLHLTDHCMKESVSIMFLFRDDDDTAVKSLLPSDHYSKHREGNCDEAKTLINVQLNSHELKDFC